MSERTNTTTDAAGTSSANRPQRVSTFAEKFFRANPFSENDPRYQLFERLGRRAAEEIALHTEKMTQRPRPTSDEEIVAQTVEARSGYFDILSEKILQLHPPTSKAVMDYEEMLLQSVDSDVELINKNYPASPEKPLLLSELRRRLRGRAAHWTAHFLKLIRKYEAEVQDRHPSDGETQAAPSTVIQTDQAIIGMPKHQECQHQNHNHNQQHAVTVRRGYRKEVNAWKKAKGIETNDQAAKNLGVSVSTLKSIMSGVGKPKYGPATLHRVLAKITPISLDV